MAFAFIGAKILRLDRFIRESVARQADACGFHDDSLDHIVGDGRCHRRTVPARPGSMRRRPSSHSLSTMRE